MAHPPAPAPVAEARPQSVEAPMPPSLKEAVAVWARIGLLSFGGPAGQIALMHKVLVEEKRWIGESRFLHALNYCMLLPGPEAQQLATYVGWLLNRTAGGLAAGLLFILPGALVMLGLSITYALFKDAPLVSAIFFGIKAAVLAVVVEALLRISRRALKNRIMWAIAAGAFLAIFVLKVPFPLIILAGGLIGFFGVRLKPGWFGVGAGGKAEAPEPASAVDRLAASGQLGHAAPSAARAVRTALLWGAVWLAPVAILAFIAGTSSVWFQLAGFFSVMAVVTFGGAYAVLAYVAQAAVSTYGWLAPGEMLDGLGLAETTPGPLLMVLQFVGFLAAFRAPGGLDPVLAGALGGVITLWVTFAPSFLWIFVGGPYVEQLRGDVRLSAALSAITAAVVGVILNLAVWFALHVLFREVVARDWGPDLPVLLSLDWRAAVLGVAALIAMLRFKTPMLWTLLACALAGLVLVRLPA